MRELPEPILFHALKHHLQHIRQFIRAASLLQETDVKAILQTIGNSQLDLYTGFLSPLQISLEVKAQLEKQSVLTPEFYKRYLTAAETDYRIVNLSDKSEWVLRWGLQAERYVHLHPARYAENTVRVKATALKTAIAAIIFSNNTSLEISLSLINQVRTKWLELSQIKTLPVHEGLGKIIDLLKEG